MPFLIKIPAKDYDRFVMRCDTRSQAYSILKKTVVNANEPDQGLVHMHCQEDEAIVLLLRASHVYPDAIPAISAALDQHF